MIEKLMAAIGVIAVGLFFGWALADGLAAPDPFYDAVQFQQMKQ